MKNCLKKKKLPKLNQEMLQLFHEKILLNIIVVSDKTDLVSHGL